MSTPDGGTQYGATRTAVAGLDIFNPLDWDAPVTFYENDNENFGLTMFRQAPRALRLTVKGTY